MEEEDENEETEFGQDEVMEITPAKKVFCLYLIMLYPVRSHCWLYYSWMCNTHRHTHIQNDYSSLCYANASEN